MVIYAIRLQNTWFIFKLSLDSALCSWIWELWQQYLFVGSPNSDIRPIHILRWLKLGIGSILIRNHRWFKLLSLSPQNALNVLLSGYKASIQSFNIWYQYLLHYCYILHIMPFHILKWPKCNWLKLGIEPILVCTP